MATYHTRNAMPYSQGYRKAKFLGKGNNIASSLTNLSSLFHGTHHPKAGTCLTPLRPRRSCRAPRRVKFIVSSTQTPIIHPSPSVGPRAMSYARCKYNYSRENASKAGPSGAGMSAERS